MAGEHDDTAHRELTRPNGAGHDGASDPFDPRRLRLSQRLTEGIAVRKALITVPVRKPSRQEFIRVHPDENWQLPTVVLELKEDRETYLIEPDLQSELAGECVPKVLYAAVNRQNVVTLWPVRLPDENGRLDAWNQSAHEAAQRAQSRWVRVAANMSLGAYDVFEAMGPFPEPQWPATAFEELLRIAFKGRYIDSLDHPVLRRLRGEF
jgi:hypothetical protein